MKRSEGDIFMMARGRIVGTGSTTPRRILTNKELESIVDTSDEWITRRTGIKERRISSNGRGENTSDMATTASLKALQMAGISPETLDMIVVGTVTPDRQFPSAACFVQKALDAGKAMAFDVSAGCSGFLYALSVAKVCWLVLKKDKTLVRVEGNNYHIPLGLEERVEVNPVMKNVEIFDVYHEKDKILVLLQQYAKEPISFMIQGISKPVKKKKIPITPTNKKNNIPKKDTNTTNPLSSPVTNPTTPSIT